MTFFKPEDFKPEELKNSNHPELPYVLDKWQMMIVANIANAKRDEALEEAIDILRSVAAAGGFSIPFRAREWLKKYGDNK